MDFTIHVDTKLLLAALPFLVALIIAKFRALRHVSEMPTRKQKPARNADSNTTIVRAVNRLTDSEPVRGEDLLPQRLAKELQTAKKAANYREGNKKRNN